MTEQSLPQRTLERKMREAEALKANLKKRKAQAKASADLGKQKIDGEP